MIIEAAVSFGESLLWVVFQTLFHSSSRKGAGKFIGAAVATACLTANIWLADRYVLYSPYTAVVDFAVLIIYSALCLKGKWYWKIFTIIVYDLSLFCCNFLCIAVFNTCFHAPVEALLSPGNGWRLGILLTTKILLIVIMGIVLWLGRGINTEKNGSIVVILIPVLIFTTAIFLANVFLNYYDIKDHVSALVLPLASISGLAMICIYLLKDSLQEREHRMKNQMLQQQIAIQEQAYKQIYDNARSVGKMQHDIKHRLVVAEQCIHQGDMVNGERYIRGLLEELEGVEGIPLENSVWKTVISMKRKKAEDQHIECQMDIKEQGLSKIQPVDLCILMGNILDNAIEAEEKFSNDRQIRLLVREEFGVIFIKVENKIEADITEQESAPRSSKKIPLMHGFGIPCVQDLVKKYDGRINFLSRDGWFCVEIWI